MSRKLNGTRTRYLKRLKPTYSPRSLDSKRSIINRFIDYLQKSHPEIKCWSQLKRRPHVDGWLQSLLYLNARSRTTKLSCMKVFFNDLVAWQWAEAPPLGLLTTNDYPPLDRLLPKPLPPDIDRAVMNALVQVNRFPALGLRLLRMTGMRVGEMRTLPLQALETSDKVNFSLRVPPGKNYRERIIPLSPEAAALVKQIKKQRHSRCGRSPHFRNRKYLMVSPFGEHPTTATYHRNLVEITARIKTSERIYPHRLRHTFATEMVRAGMPLPALMKILGHETPRMTMHYVELVHEDLREAYDHAHSQLKMVQNIRLPELIPEEGSTAVSAHPTDIIDTLLTRLESIRRDSTEPTQRELILRVINRLRKVKDEIDKII
jgi:site-specific recombinase XerD